MGAFEQGVAQSGDFICYRIEQRCACLGRGETEAIECGFSRLQCLIGFRVSSIAINRLKLGAGGGIEGVEQMALWRGFAACDEVVSGECHGFRDWE
jgi:hypothetical protein